MMRITVRFYSYFKDIAETGEMELSLPDGAVLEDALDQIYGRFAKLAPARKSALAAVGLDYQPRDHPLKDGDEIALFPPVQGG